MDSDDVADLLGRLSDRGLRSWVGGGWAVDALVGRPTRSHQDLDLAVDTEQLDELLQLLAELGFAPRENWLPIRIEVADQHDRRVDLHPLRFAPDGSAVQAGPDGTQFAYPNDGFTTGHIGGRVVGCLTARQQLRFREGYRWRTRDHHDVPLLRELVRAAGSGEPEETTKHT